MFDIEPFDLFYFSIIFQAFNLGQDWLLQGTTNIATDQGF